MPMLRCLLALCVGMALQPMAGAADAEWQGKLDPALLAQLAAGGEADLLVRLRDSADVSRAAQLPTKQDKGRYVYSTLARHARESQAALRADLDARGLPYQSFWIVNAVATRGNLGVAQALAERDDVAQVHATGGMRLTTPVARVADATASKAGPPRDPVEPGLRLLRAPEVWALGFRGQGVVVGDHDIGVAWEHPALKGKYRGWNGTTASHGYNWHNAFKADPFCTDRNVPCDSHDHGTHTTGTMVGDDGVKNQIGMAPDAKWMACRSLFDPVVGVGTVPAYLECMEWTLAPYPGDSTIGADPDQAPDVVNNSWGCVEACPFDLLRETNDAIKLAGIIQVVSAGNDGQGGVQNADCSTIAFPLAIYDSSFTVGATNFDDEMADFSSRGPVLTDLSMRIKPNVVAPGVGVRSSVASGDYAAFSGTSMSGPHVAGLVALMLSAEPRLKGQVDLVRTIIESTAVPIKTTQVCGGTGEADIPNNVFGFGRVDALAAVQAIPQFMPGAPAAKTQGKGLLLGALSPLALAGLMLVVAARRRR